MDPILPRWAAELRDRYLAGEASVFIVHGNVRDLQPWHEPDGTTRWIPLRAFLERFLRRNKDPVVAYDVAEGLSFVDRAAEEQLRRAVNARRLLQRHEPLDALPRGVGPTLAMLEDLLTDPAQRAAVVLDYVEAIVPNGDLAFMGEQDKANLVTLLRLGGDPALLASDNLLVLVTESLADVNRRLTTSGHVALVEVPLPDEHARSAFLGSGADRSGVRVALDDAQLVKVTAGLSLTQIRGLFRAARQSGAEVDFATVNRRKKSILEQECSGLVEFVDPAHGFADVGGMDGVKTELTRIAEAIRAGQRARVPMGVIFVGPMGTGKTFVAEAFARESGLTCLKFKNFREKWVGSTEANLERILQVVDALGYVLLILDEADRSLGGSADNDGGTSSRVIARLKEFMSDTSHRGRVVILMMTNRPDKLDTDLKRPGRFDVKVPFFFPETADERRRVAEAVARRAGVAIADDASLQPLAEVTDGRSAAEIEAVVLAAGNLAAWEGRAAVTSDDLARAAADVVPSRDTRMLAYMEMLAVFEASARRMLPERYRDLSTEDVQARLDVLRSQLGARVA
jgi:transitional endoplasmic reticulum ATPase